MMRRALLVHCPARALPPPPQQPQQGFFRTVWAELKKLGPRLNYEIDEVRNQAAGFSKVLQGVDGTPEQVAKEQRHKAAYAEVMSRQAQKEQAEWNKRKAAVASASWRERLQTQLNEALESAKSMTSKQSGMLRIVQHCAAAHAAEVAVEQGIDVHSVQIVLEEAKVPAQQGIAAESKVVGYIDAPAASEEEVMMFAQRLTKACPAARAMEGRIEWRQRQAPGRTDDDSPSGDNSRDMPFSTAVSSSSSISDEPAANSSLPKVENVSVEPPASVDSGAAPSSGNASMEGMPGFRRRFEPHPRSQKPATTQKPLRFD